MPSGSDAKSAGGNSQLAFNFNYTLPVPNPASVPTQTVLSLGLESGTTAGKHYTIIPITAGQVVGLNGGSPTSGGQAYAGAGVGVYIINGSGFATAGRIGTYGELGYNITSNLYAEARYQDVSHASGFTLQAGLRF